MARWDILLRQSEWWVTREGHRIRVAEMEPRHAANAAAMLRRRAGVSVVLIANRWVDEWEEQAPIASYLDTAPDGAYDAAMGALRELEERQAARTPEEWISGTPLVKALDARAEAAVPA